MPHVTRQRQRSARKSSSQVAGLPANGNGKTVYKRRLTEGKYVRVMLEVPQELSNSIDAVVKNLKETYILSSDTTTKEQLAQARVIVREKNLAEANKFLRDCIRENRTKLNPLGEPKKPNRNSFIIKLLELGMLKYGENATEQQPTS